MFCQVKQKIARDGNSNNPGEDTSMHKTENEAFKAL